MRNFKEFRDTELSADSANAVVNYKNAVFCVPSPQLVCLYLKRLGVYPDRSLVNTAANTDKYTTTSKKAINLGIYSVDLAYINLFTVSENTNEYIKVIDRLAGSIGLQVVFTRSVYDHIMHLKSNQDSLARYLSDIFSKADRYLKANSQEQISALIITGGWVESFYLLCQAYRKQPAKQMAALIYQQKFVLDNIIKILAPYYVNSPDLQPHIDDLVEMAYEFDVLDFKYTYKLPIYRYRKGVMVFENSLEIENPGKSIDNIYLKIAQLRDVLID